MYPSTKPATGPRSQWGRDVGLGHPSPAAPIPVAFLKRALLLVALLVSVVLATAGCDTRQEPLELVDGRHSLRAGTEQTKPAEPPETLPGLLRIAEDHARSLGRDVDRPPRLLSIMQGSFTRAGASEELALYLVSLWPRCCPMVGLALFRDGAPVRHTAFDGSYQALVLFPGGGGDGRDGVFLEGSFGQGGSISSSLTLLAFDGDAWREAGSLPVYGGNCGSGPTGGEESAYRILGDAMGRLFREEYLSDCSGVWERVGEREEVEAEVSGWREPTGFVELGLGG